MSLQFVFERRYSMAHRLLNSPTRKCAVPHGHNEFIRVTLAANQGTGLDPKTNMLQSFEQAKSRWHQFIDEHLDHAFQLSASDPMLNFFREHEPECLERVLVLPGDPTTEMLCVCLMSKLQTFLDHDGEVLQCLKLEIEETPTNRVVLDGFRAFEQYLPTESGWWQCNDMSIS